MAYETFEEFLNATRSARKRPTLVGAWQAGRDSAIARVEAAEAALADSKRLCVWSWSAYGAAWFAQCDGLAFADTRWFTHCPRCGRRINFRAKVQP